MSQQNETEPVNLEGLIIPGRDESPTAAQSESTPERVVECAFLIYLDAEGHWVAEADISSVRTVSTRPANLNDFFLAASTVLRDVNEITQAHRNVNTHMQVLEQISRRQEDAKVQQMLMGKGGLHI